MNLSRIAFRALLSGALMSAAVSRGWAAAARQITTFAGTGLAGYSGDNGSAGKAQLKNPYGITRGPEGALYICDMENHRIRKVSRDGNITTVAGTGKRGYSGDGGPALQAELNEPYEVRFDKAGDLFFVEMRNHIVRRVDGRTKFISTAAGSGKEGFSGDGGQATIAQLRQPHSIQFDARGYLFICDIGNNRIRKVDLSTGMISTFVGTGERLPSPDGAKLANAPLNGPRAIDFDKAGNMWLALREGNAIYRLDLEAGTIHHVAGTGQRKPREAAAKGGEQPTGAGPLAQPVSGHCDSTNPDEPPRRQPVYFRQAGNAVGELRADTAVRVQIVRDVKGKK